MIVIASVILAAAIVFAAVWLEKGLSKVSRMLVTADETEFVSLDKLMAEQYPEQFSTLPQDMLLEDDFSLLD
jgi:uncharacterized membrane protein YphA (DoxX/SURF4 family)